MYRPSSHNPRAKALPPNNKEINSSVSKFKNDVLAALSVKLLPNNILLRTPPPIRKKPPNNHILRTPPPMRRNQPFSSAGQVLKVTRN